MVLVGADEDDRPLVRRDLLGERASGPRGSTGCAARARRSACRSPPVQPDPAKITTVSSSPCTASWMIRRASSRSRVVCRPVPLDLGVRVGVAGQHLVADEVLEEGQGPPGCRVVGVRHAAPAVGRGHHLVLTDDGLANAAHQRLLARLRCRAIDHGDRVSRAGCRRLRHASPCRFAQPCTLAYRRPGEPPTRLVQRRVLAAHPQARRDPRRPGPGRLRASCATSASRASRPRRWPTGPASRAAPSSTTSPRSSRCSPPASPSSSPRSARASTPAPSTRTCSTAPLAVVTDPGDVDLLERIGVLAAAGEASPHARGLILVELHAWLDWLEGWLRRRLGPDATDVYVATLASGLVGAAEAAFRVWLRAGRHARMPAPRHPTLDAHRLPPRLLHRRDRPRPHRPGPPARHRRRAHRLTLPPTSRRPPCPPSCTASAAGAPPTPGAR